MKITIEANEANAQISRYTFCDNSGTSSSDVMANVKPKVNRNVKMTGGILYKGQ